MAILSEVYSPFEPSSIDAVSFRPSAFFLPPLTLGFCAEVEDAVGPQQGPTAFLTAVVTAEGKYLEPTVGQIWPR